ncbi:Mlo-related protein [Macleaya cordata]|uniref:MLO-like protein n=1 Tax=Macleaya cordata TaxID=56857 RepID=A0A200R5W0_MACCD|nr:Mlo-related protein [Macleaya cordata]
MAGGGGTGRSLEQTPTWAVAVVCFALVVISIIIEHIIHLIGKWFTKKNKRALYEALEKIKSELMLLGFLSLLLTVAQGPISEFCIPKSVADTWHPCKKKQEQKLNNNDTTSPSHNSDDADDSEDLTTTLGRRLLSSSNPLPSLRRGKVSFVSSDGIHQLHIFIFVLAVSHVLYCIITMALGRAKMRRWKSWEKETKTVEYQFTHDPERFRFARDTSFGRRHLNFWSKSPVLIWIVCFFRQFVRSVPKVDYLTLRHGFIMAHLAPQSSIKFDFQKYINRSLEEDFKVVVGISPPIWFFAVLFLLFNTHGWYSYLWLPFIPFIIILLVGTKLQVIVTRMGLRIQERGDVVKGVPTVEPADDLFWFNRPRLILYLIHFVLFQNAFQLAFFAWTWYEFGLRSCFHEHLEDVIIRISMGVLIQFLCSYVTLPLYALVTQMGSSMKSTIFNDRVATALRKWHHTARKHIKQNQQSRTVTPMSSRPVTPMSSRPATPTHGLSPVHLLRYYRNEVDSLQTSPRLSNMENDNWDSEGSPSPMHHHQTDGSSSHHHRSNLGTGPEEEVEMNDIQDLSLSNLPPPSATINTTTSVQHEIDIGTIDSRNQIKIGSMDFSFDKR